MYAPIDANANGSDPISYSSQLFLYRPFTSEIAPNSQANPAPPFPIFDFHLPFEDHDDFFYHDLLFHHQPLAEQAADQVTMGSGIQISNPVHSMDQHVRVTTTGEHGHQNQHQTPRNRTFKGDRHTKIDTAQGPRDRRMRLSLEVAKKFFGLQDMLRFDKPSRTIEWLLNQAKYEIKRLERETKFPVGCNAGCSPSESEVVSGLDEATASASNDKQAKAKPSEKRRKTRQSRKTVSHPRTKEIRERARARARERTEEKNIRSQKFAQEEDSGHCSEATNHKSSIFGEAARTECRYSTNGSLDVMSKAQERSFQIREQSGVFHDQCPLTMSKWNLPFSFQFPAYSQTAQLAALEFLDKQWETCDNHNLR